MMRDIGACFCYALNRLNEGIEENNIMKPYGGLPLNFLKTAAFLTADLSSLVVQGINCFFNIFHFDTGTMIA